MLNVPMFATEAVRQIWLWYQKTWKKRDGSIAGWCALLLLAGYAGTFAPFSVGQETTRNIRKGVAKLWETVLPQVFEAAGFAGVEGIGRVVPACFLLIAIVVLGGCVFQLLKRKGEGQMPLAWAYFLLWMSLGVTMAAAAFTTTDTSRRYYFVILPLMAFGFICFLHSVKEKAGFFRIAGIFLTLFLLFFQVWEIYLPILQSEEPPKTTEYEVCQYLRDNDYETAYADFYKGNVITVLSHGSVRGAAVASMERMDVCKWLSSKDWYAPNMPYHSRTAYVVSEEEQEAFEKFRAQHLDEIRLETKIGYLYIYGSDYNLSSL